MGDEDADRLAIWESLKVQPLFAIGSARDVFIALTFVLALFITYTHRANIRRLIAGTERAFPSLQVWRRLLRK